MNYHKNDLLRNENDILRNDLPRPTWGRRPSTK